jgi:hypothetical protein
MKETCGVYNLELHLTRLYRSMILFKFALWTGGKKEMAGIMAIEDPIGQFYDETFYDANALISYASIVLNSLFCILRH